MTDPSPKGKILLVDDDPALLEVVGTRLKACGYQVISAANGLEAIQIARSEKPDLIIMDLLMPLMGGAGAVIALKEDKKTKKIPIFFLTGADLDGNDLVRERIGVDVIFRKPFSLKELLDKIAEVLVRRAGSS